MDEGITVSIGGCAVGVDIATVAVTDGGGEFSLCTWESAAIGAVEGLVGSSAPSAVIEISESFAGEVGIGG
jgi:hypothetical protein